MTFNCWKYSFSERSAWGVIPILTPIAMWFGVWILGTLGNAVMTTEIMIFTIWHFVFSKYSYGFFSSHIQMWVVVQLCSNIRLFASPWTSARQGSLSFTICQSLLKLFPLSRWCQTTISSSAVTFSSCHQSFPTVGSFPMSQLSIPGGQNIGI